MNVFVVNAVDAVAREDAAEHRVERSAVRTDTARALALAWLRLSQDGKARITADPPRKGHR